MSTKMKWKAAIKIWLVIYPSITAFYYFLGEVLAALPLYLRTLLVTLALVPWMIFIGVPLVEALLKKLFSDAGVIGKRR